MSKGQKVGVPTRVQSSEHSNSNTHKRKGAEGEAERGRRALKKLLPAQPMVLIKRLVQKGAGLGREMLSNQRLLPSLTLKSMQGEMFERLMPQQNSFEEMDRSITHSMLSFEQNACSHPQQAELIDLQTQKCYRKIPPCFFQPTLTPEHLARLLTRERGEAQESREELGDYYDEVQFNVNQQVGYKMKVFMTFVSFLTSVGNLADLSLMKIKGTRVKNQMVREIVVQRAERVNALRARKEEIELSLSALTRLKKLKRLENLLMSQVQAKGKITLAEAYQEYCEAHEQIKDYCCSRMICRYWDVAYYIERGYHDSFSRSLKNYIREIILVDEQLIRDILHPKKQDYVTVNPIRTLDDPNPNSNLDESYEIDDADIELVTKHNIEREIVSVFKQGLHRCTYSTDETCEQISSAIRECERKLYSIMRGDQGGVEEVGEGEKKALLDKLTVPKYVRVVEEWSERMKKVVRREVSVIQRALSATQVLRGDFPEKEEVICSYLMQIVYVSFLEIDSSIACLVKLRKLKLHEAAPIKQLLTCSQRWKDFILDFRSFPCVWGQLKAHFAADQQDSESKIMEGLLSKFLSTRRRIVELMIDVYNRASVEGLPGRLQEEEWKTVSIPSRYYNTLGEILYGPSFSKHIQSLERKLLSSSLLLERNSSILVSSDHDTRPEPKRESFEGKDSKDSIDLCEFDLQVGENTVGLLGERFKVLGSTLGMLDLIEGYLQWASEGEGVEGAVLGKVLELLIVYNENVKKLILGKEALNYGRIKSKSITAKHLVIAYSQLKFFRVLTQALARRLPFKHDILHVLLDKNMAQITKKFRTVLELAINESINRMVVDPRKAIVGPVGQTVEIVTAVNRSSEYVKDILLGSGEMGQFIGIPWCVRYLQQVRTQYKSVYKCIMNSNGSRRSKDIDWTDNIYWKFKELQYIVQNLQDFRPFLPGFEQLQADLEGERKKLENPN